MTTFTRYFDNPIREWIETPGQQTLVEGIRKMDVNALEDFRKDLNTEVSIDPSTQHTHAFKISCKTVIRCMQGCRHRGEALTATQGNAPSIFEVIEAGMMGAIIGDEFAKRFKG